MVSFAIVLTALREPPLLIRRRKIFESLIMIALLLVKFDKDKDKWTNDQCREFDL